MQKVNIFLQNFVTPIIGSSDIKNNNKEKNPRKEEQKRNLI